VSRKLLKREPDIMPAVFSDDSARVMARFLGIKPEQTNKFRAAFTLLPLSRLKECIDMAYQLSIDGGDVEIIASWLDRYDRQSRKLLPQWARKNSHDYLKKARAALKAGPDSAVMPLFEFKGFIYAVFCRRLIDYYSEVSHGKSTANGRKSKPL
jgi:hypothetical protein